jgi:CheY-like chemotaxis protein
VLVLVVDDSAFARSRIVRTLKQAGHTVIEAESGKQALELFAAQHPDVVTVDLLMPEMDGIELIQRLRALDEKARVVAVTADIQAATRTQVFAAGASAYVSKIDQPTELLHIVETAAMKPPPPILTPAQRDAFTEMMNIAMGQAAHALSSLVEHRVILQVPHIEILSAVGLRLFCEEEVRQVGAVVQQFVSGQISGVAALVLPYDHTLALIRVLLASDSAVNHLTSAAQPILSEVGNIVLNATVARIGDQFETRLHLSQPQTLLNQAGSAVAEQLLRSVPVADHAIVFLSRMRVSDIELLAFVTLLFPDETVRRLLASLQV